MISRDGGLAWARNQKLTTSADASSGVAITAIASSARAGQRVVIDDLLVSVGTDMTISLRSATTNTTFCTLYLLADSPTQITLRNGLGCPDAEGTVELVA